MGLTTMPPDWLNRQVTEAELQSQALKLMRDMGWKEFHDRVAWKSDPGWLDVTAVHVGMRRTVFIEFKKETGKVSPKQQEWIDAHRAAGNEVMVVRPSDWAVFVRFVVPPHLLRWEPAVAQREEGESRA